MPDTTSKFKKLISFFAEVEEEKITLNIPGCAIPLVLVRQDWMDDNEAWNKVVAEIKKLFKIKSIEEIRYEAQGILAKNPANPTAQIKQSIKVGDVRGDRVVVAINDNKTVYAKSTMKYYTVKSSFHGELASFSDIWAARKYVAERKSIPSFRYIDFKIYDNSGYEIKEEKRLTLKELERELATMEDRLYGY